MLRRFCENIILEDFGEIARDIVRALFRQGRQTLKQLQSVFLREDFLEPAFWSLLNAKQRKDVESAFSELLDRTGDRGLTQEVYRALNEKITFFQFSQQDMRQLALFLFQDSRQKEINDRVRHIIQVLIQHHCVYVTVDSDGLDRNNRPKKVPVLYNVDPDFIELRPRASQYVAMFLQHEAANPSHGEISVIIAQIITHGRLSERLVVELFRHQMMLKISRNQERIQAQRSLLELLENRKPFPDYKRSLSNRGITKYASLALCEKLFHHIDPSNWKQEIAINFAPEGSEWLRNLGAHDQEQNIVNHCKELWNYLQQQNYIEKVPALMFYKNPDTEMDPQIATSRAGSDNEIQWRLNHRRFLLDQRCAMLTEYYTQRYDPLSGHLLRLLLTSRGNMSSPSGEEVFVKKEGGQNRFRVTDLQTEDFMNMNQLLVTDNVAAVSEKLRELVRCDSSERVPPLLLSKRGKFAANVQALVKDMCILNAQKIVAQRHGAEGARIFKLLIYKKMLSATQVSSLARIDVKRSHAVLFRLYKDEWAHCQEFPEYEDERRTKESIYGWSINWKGVRKKLVHDFRFAYLNLSAKQAVLLAKKEAEEREIKDMMGNVSELKIQSVDRLATCIEKIQLYMLRLDNEIALHRFF